MEWLCSVQSTPPNPPSGFFFMSYYVMPCHVCKPSPSLPPCSPPQDGLLFDNILVSDDVQQAAELRQSRWQSKLDLEKAADKERTEKEEEEEERKRKQASGGSGIKNQVLVRREGGREGGRNALADAVRE